MCIIYSLKKTEIMKGKETKKEKKKEKAEAGKPKEQSEYQREKSRKGESSLNIKPK